MKDKPIRRNTNFRFFLIAFILSATLLSSDVVSITPTDIFDAEFDTQVEVLMNSAKVESLALSVINGTEEYYLTGFGEQPGTDIIYYINDISGVIATTALLQLMEDGFFDIDDPVNDYLPWILRNPYFPSTEITIHDILSQRAGIELSLETRISLNEHIYPFPDVLYETFDEAGAYYTNDSWQNSDPGTAYEGEWIYYDMVAYLVEIISNEPYEQYVINNIFTPLGMIDTEFTYTNYTLSQLAKQYLWNSTSGVNEEVSFRDTYIYSPGSAGILSSVDDLSKFLIVHMNNGVYDSVRILEESSVNLMHTNLGSGRGLGWAFNVENGYQGLVGSIFGDTFILTKTNVGIVIFTNQCQFLSGIAGAIRDIVDYITTTTDELIIIPPSTTETNFEMFALPILLVGLGTVVVYLKRKKD